MAVIFSYELDGQSTGRELFGDDIRQMLEDDRLAWVHLDLNSPKISTWLSENVGYLGDPLLSALLANETRPRVSVSNDGLLLILRSVNQNSGSKPEDMVSIRLWIDSHRIISVQKRPSKAVEELCDDIRSGLAPKNSAEFIDQLLLKLLEGTSAEIETRVIAVDDIEDEIFETGKVQPVEKISLERRKNIILQRFIRPQKDVIQQIHNSDLSWINIEKQTAYYEIYQGYLRLSEELELNNERLRLSDDEVSKQTQERLNRNLYRISALSAIFLPLGFLTGLLGVNIGGMPGVSSSYAFGFFCFLLLLIFGFQVYLMRKFRWL